jgi:hypothetical protein
MGGSDVGGQKRRLVAPEKETDTFRKLAKAIDFGDDCVHADILRSSVMHGEKKDGNFRRQFLKLRRGRIAAHSGHREVKNNQVGLICLHTSDSLASIGCFLKRIGAGVFGQEFFKNAAEDIAVVHDKNRIGHKK